MKRLFLPLLALAATTLAGAGTFDLGANGSLVTPALPGWTETPNHPPAGVGPTLTLSPTNGVAVKAAVTVTFTPKPTFKDPAALAQVLEQSGARFAPSSLEGKTIQHPLERTTGHGAYASFTDKDLVGKPPQPGNFKVMTVVILYLDDHVTIGATVFCDELSSPEFTQVLKYLSAVQLTPAPAATPARP